MHDVGDQSTLIRRAPKISNRKTLNELDGIIVSGVFHFHRRQTAQLGIGFDIRLRQARCQRRQTLRGNRLAKHFRQITTIGDNGFEYRIVGKFRDAYQIINAHALKLVRCKQRCEGFGLRFGVIGQFESKPQADRLSRLQRAGLVRARTIQPQTLSVQLGTGNYMIKGQGTGQHVNHAAS